MAWCPTWPPGCNTCDGSCDQLLGPLVSEPLATLTPPLPSDGQLLAAMLEIFEGRGRSFVAQGPEVSNDYTLVIGFDDDPERGPAHYDVGLSFTFGP